MPFHTKIQPIDSDVSEDLPFPETRKQMPKSRLKRLFERQFTIKNTSERFTVGDFEAPLSRGNSGDFEPSSVCLAKMVLNFIEDNSNGEKQRCGRSRCSCFTGSGTESSDDESEWSDGRRFSSGEACEILKSLVLCTSICERNLMADVTKIVETSKNCKRKDESCLKIVANGLVSLGYDAAPCKSRWEKTPSYPAGEYEYVDVLIEGERLLIDIDFKSNFEIARATKTYKSILQTMPCIFVGKADRLQRIIMLLSKAAKQSLKKKGLHLPPWRRVEYVKSKWLSPYVRADQNSDAEDKQEPVDMLTKSLFRGKSINTTNRKEAMDYTGNKLKKHNLEAEIRLKKVEKDYLHTSQKYTETESQLRSLNDERSRADSLCSSAAAFIARCNKVVENLHEALKKLPTTEEAIDHSLRVSTSNSVKILAQENMMIFQQKAQYQKLDCEAIRDFREITGELNYIQRKMPRSDSRKSVHDLLKEVKEKNKCKDKALLTCTLVCNLTSRDNLRKSVELEIKVLKKLIRELQKDWEGKLHIRQSARNLYSDFKRKVRHLEKKKEHLSGQWDEEKRIHARDEGKALIGG